MNWGFYDLLFLRSILFGISGTFTLMNVDVEVIKLQTLQGSFWVSKRGSSKLCQNQYWEVLLCHNYIVYSILGSFTVPHTTLFIIHEPKMSFWLKTVVIPTKRMLQINCWSTCWWLTMILSSCVFNSFSSDKAGEEFKRYQFESTLYDIVTKEGTVVLFRMFQFMFVF